MGRAQRVVVLTPVVAPVAVYSWDTHPSTLKINHQLLGVLVAVERLPVVNCRGPVITLGQREVLQGDQLQHVRTSGGRNAGAGCGGGANPLEVTEVVRPPETGDS